GRRLRHLAVHHQGPGDHRRRRARPGSPAGQRPHLTKVRAWQQARRRPGGPMTCSAGPLATGFQEVRFMFKTLLLAGAALAIATSASAKDLKAVGVTVGSLGNPFFVAVGKGATDAAHRVNPDAKVTIASADYDLNKQF